MGTRGRVIAMDMAFAFSEGRNTDGNQLLERLMNMQDTSAPVDDPRRGNLSWADDQERPTDLNSLSFCGPFLGYVALEHHSKITTKLSRRFWDTTLPECLIGFDGHYHFKSGAQPHGPSPRWWQCNIWSLNIAGRLMIGQALTNNGHVDKARQQLSDYRRYIELYGIGEYNSPDYLVVQLEGMHWTWHYAGDVETRQNARAILDETYIDLAEHYHAPSGVLGGTWSRHYERDFLGRSSYTEVVAAMFAQTQPSLLTQLGLDDYKCPKHIREIGLKEDSYSVWRRSVSDAQRTMYQTPEYSLATQSGDYVWKQQDTPVLATYVAEKGERRVALLRCPYWPSDELASMVYSNPFIRWAHQYQNQAILSYLHEDEGNDLLFNVATLGDFWPELVNGQGLPLDPPSCAIMPAPIITEFQDRQTITSHHIESLDLTYVDPLDRQPPGLPFDGPVLVGFPSCFMALIPQDGLQLRVAVMRNDLYVVIPVRPTAIIAVLMVGRSQCPSIGDFADRVTNVHLALTQQPNLGQAVSLQGFGATLTAGISGEAGLFDRRVDGVSSVDHGYLCHSPFYRRQSGEALGAAGVCSK